ncbi:MAG TPA: twin-arginine translocase subunit TatC [Tepidisphaeraceae bacterium]|nr:twin-arginine translocase subunit TatC [Tepidisphaeraceae bacterium]
MTAGVTELAKPVHLEDPDEYRMSVGDHLEDLRRRLLLGLGGFVIAFIGCCLFGDTVIGVFCRPLVIAMRDANVNPQIYYNQISDGFMVYMEMSVISALAISSPWILYQIWLFVAAGLYPRERKYITKYLPLSVTLLISGMLFLYFFVLPISMEFFLRFSSEIPLKMPEVAVAPGEIPAKQSPVQVPIYAGNPANPQERQIWVDAKQERLKIFMDGQVRVIPFGPENLAAPIITLPQYIDMVVQMLLAFGISFQMPLVVMALVRIGIVELPALKKLRRIIYFGMAIIAAMIIPDVVTGMLALTVPLILLYEFGLWLAARKPATEETS